jgi:hypothetical protein
MGPPELRFAPARPCVSRYAFDNVTNRKQNGVTGGTKRITAAWRAVTYRQFRSIPLQQPGLRIVGGRRATGSAKKLMKHCAR